jgi:hypothetical protein
LIPSLLQDHQRTPSLPPLDNSTSVEVTRKNSYVSFIASSHIRSASGASSWGGRGKASSRRFSESSGGGEHGNQAEKEEEGYLKKAL